MQSVRATIDRFALRRMSEATSTRTLRPMCNGMICVIDVSCLLFVRLFGKCPLHASPSSRTGRWVSWFKSHTIQFRMFLRRVPQLFMIARRVPPLRSTTWAGIFVKVGVLCTVCLTRLVFASERVRSAQRRLRLQSGVNNANVPHLQHRRRRRAARVRCSPTNSHPEFDTKNQRMYTKTRVAGNCDKQKETPHNLSKICPTNSKAQKIPNS